MTFNNGRGLGRTGLVLTMLCLVSCGSGTQGTSGSDGQSNGVDKAEVAAGDLQNVALPYGLAKMPGAKVTNADVPSGGSEGSPTSKVNLEVGASSADVAKFYKAEFKRLGIAAENNMVMSGNIILTGKAPSGEDIVINAEDGTGGAATKMTVATAKASG